MSFSKFAFRFLGLYALFLCLNSPAAAQPMDQRLRDAVAAGELVGLHSTVVMLDSNLIAEAYFEGPDERWGRPLGTVAHDVDTLHDLRSVTKSVVGLLYGIALDEGLVPALDAPLLDQFPEYDDLRDGSDREAITVRDALTMKMGIAWNEDLPYSDPRNSEIAMERAKDRYRYILERPMVAAPGTDWTYNGGAVALIARLIAKGSGMEIDAFAQKHLFEPLGISDFEWVRGADGVPSAASGLRLTARDLAKIGALVAQGGAIEGRQIVPSDWLDASFQPASTLMDNFDYGFLWYLTRGPSGDPIVIALGNGGQRLTVQPQQNFVVATFAGNYNQRSAWQTPLRVLLDFAVPEVARVRAK